MKKIDLTAAARRDLDEIENYIENHYSVPNSVAEFRVNLDHALMTISKSPGIGSPYSGMLRKWVYKHYVHLYVEYSKSVRVLQVAFDRTDWANKIRERMDGLTDN